MAQLNSYRGNTGLLVSLPNKPVDRGSPNAIARITPKSSRPFAKAAYTAWVAGGMALPWDGTYNDGAPQNLTYNNE